MPSFLNSDRTLTGDGQKLVQFIEAQFHEADAANDVTRLNGLPGTLQQYYINVYKLKSHTATQWLEEFGRSWAQDAWRFMEYIEAQAAQTQAVTENTDRTAKLTEGLDELKAQLTAAMAEIEALKAARDAKPEETPAPVETPDPAPKGDAEAVK